MTLVKVVLDIGMPDGRKIETEFFPVERQTGKKVIYTAAEWKGGKFRKESKSVYREALGRARREKGGSLWRRAIWFLTREDDIRKLRKGEEMTRAILAMVWNIKREMQDAAAELARIEEAAEC